MAASQVRSDELRRVAEALAQTNAESEPAIREVFWFPSDDEIRLVEVDDTLSDLEPGEVVAPFYFRPDPVGGIPFQLAIALVGTGDANHARLPQGWGDWSEARPIWRRF